MNRIDFLHSPVADALGWTLLHAIWQGFALVLPTAVALHLLRDRSSVVRYRVGVAALFAQLLASALTFSWYYEPVGSVLTAVQPLSEPAALPVRWQTLTQTLPWHQQTQQFLESHLSQFVLIYLLGVIVFGLRLAGGWLYLQRLSQTALPPATARWTSLTEQLRALLNIRAVVRVRESAYIAVPMVVGVLKPILLLPLGLATHLSLREVEAVLAHELAHVKRYDYGVNLVQSLIEVLYFFHPALWWLSARVREEREHCCDDLAVQACGGDGRMLAQALARVEELRLAEVGTPALAMAFATRRQQLLHRIRRVLHVPTRSVVSNGSLAGLTLATLLLVSASVYAIQQQDQPKPKARTTQPKPTRRHKVGFGTEFSISDNKKIDYVIWKGQKLPATRVARLQRQLDQVMAGQLNLDDVPQTDRDVLLQIIETQHSFNGGMDALGKGLAQIDYDNIVVSSLKNVPLSPDGTVEGLARVNYDSIIHHAMVSVSPHSSFSDSLKRTLAQHKLDSLMASMNAIMAQRKEAIERITKEMTAVALKSQNFEKQFAPVRELQQQQAKKLGDLARQQARLAVEQARLLQRTDAKSQTLRRQNEAELNRLQKQMDQQQRQLEQSVKQIEPLTSKFEPIQERLSILGDSISRLYAPISAASEQISELAEQISEDAVRQAEDAMRSTENLNIDLNLDTPTLPARPRPAPRPLKAVKPARPAVPVRPNVRVAPVAPVQPNVHVVPARPTAPTPVPNPKVAPTPKPVEP